MDIESARLDIVREAEKHGNQVCKLLSTGTGSEFVKVKRGYSQPEDLRSLYLDALQTLIIDGALKPIFSNRDMELYELKSAGGHISTLPKAKAKLLEEVAATGRVYKIHSDRGEFVQCSSKAYDEIEEERILMMSGLYELVRSGVLRIAKESRELCVYEKAPPSSTGFVQYEHHGHA